MKRALSGLSVLAASSLYACSGMQSQLPSSSVSAAASAVQAVPAKKGTRCTKFEPFWNQHGSALAISSIDGGVCIVSQAQNHPLVGYVDASSFTGAVFVATDRADNLFVTSQGFWGIVSKYPKNSQTATATYYVPDNASGLAVSRKGDLAVLDSGGAEAAVYIFPPNSTQACTAVVGTNFGRSLSAVTYDRAGHIFVIGQDFSNTTHVGEITGGCNAKKIKDLNLQVKFAVYGLQVDSSGNLDVLDLSTTPPQIDVFAGSSSAPGSTVVLKDATPQNLGAIAFASAGDIYLSDFGSGTVREYRYPQGSTSISTFVPFGGLYNPLGIAAFPPVTPGAHS
ncbi:MAG TPA: hypothetical protein VGF18_08710 [Candidatus Tumulicola sp.]|jgi:hypothetical protein